MMEHLFDAWQEFSDDCRAASHILLLSDYDGTLTAIVGRPEDAVLSPEVREKLTDLAHRPDFTVGIISGRSLAELKSLVAIESIYYAGNHGLEIEGPGLNYISPPAQESGNLIRDLAGQLSASLREISGVIIEDKGLSLSVHYRLVKEDEVSFVLETFDRITAPSADDGRIRITSGKKVKEVRPPIDWHKGKAVETIAREIKTLLNVERTSTVYLGDDTTDEDAFKVLHRPDGWSMYVGGENASSTAEYYLNSTEEVAEFLTRLIALR